MRSRLERVPERVLEAVVADAWSFRLDELEYVPVGGGAYHWSACADDGRRVFVTCDDLASKPWLGSDMDQVFEGLVAAYATSMHLHRIGLAFVVAPIETVAGSPAVRVDERHSISVFDHVEGEPGRWGQPVERPTLAEVVSMLADLHLSTPPSLVPRRRGFDVPGRAEFEAALEDLGGRWNGGPLSERARRVLAGEVELVRGWLRDLDRFAARSEGMDRTEVVTHGEPHPGNLIRTAGRLRLVDWDTVALARPERDLWMIDDVDPSSLDAYRGATGIALDRDALAAGRLLWALTDLAAFTEQLRREHHGNEDDDWALTGLRTILSGDEPRPYQLARSPETYSR